MPVSASAEAAMKRACDDGRSAARSKRPLGSMVTQLGSCASTGCAWRLQAAQRSQGRGRAPPDGRQRPQLLELAASKSTIAHLNAFGPLGGELDFSAVFESQKKPKL